jgi:hypothetical protein
MLMPARSARNDTSASFITALVPKTIGTLVLLLSATASGMAADRSFDVVVYGATPGGFCAAIAAAREGATVALVEPTGHVGGVNTGGLSFSDSNQTVRSTVMGLFDEWHTRIEADYKQRGIELPYQVQVKDNSRWTYEPSVAARVTQAMLDEAGVAVLSRRMLTGVEKERSRIVRLKTSQETFASKTFVDATYEGDLMAAAGVSWTIGREPRSACGESLAGKQYPKAKMPISGLDSEGRPLPLITTTTAGELEAGDRNVMVYSFRLCLTKDQDNRVPFPEPANYDPARFEVVRRYLAAEKRPILLWDIYPLPNGKFDANNGIGKQFSMGLVGGGNGWCEADAAGRQAIWEAHKQYTIELYHFLTTDPAVPEHLRRQMAEYGLCADEFPEHGHWSPQLYVREGRRMQGEYVLSQQDILDEPRKPQPIAVASFPIDSHDCQRIALADGVVNEGTIFPVRMPRRPHGYPYHVPYQSIVPKVDQCTNLLVPVALSATHVALSSIRVEPTWMILGQSAGIAAALAAQQDVAVQQLPYADLQASLLKQKQVLELPVLPELPPMPPATAVDPATLPGIVLDDAQAELIGPWVSSRNFANHIGRGYLHDDRRGDGQSKAVFRTKLPKSGRYHLSMAYSAHETRAKQTPIVIESGGRTEHLTVDQTIPLPKDAALRRIATLSLSGEGETAITVTNAGTSGFVIVDALQLAPADEPESR